MAINHDLLISALVGLRYQVELFQEDPRSDALRAKLREAIGTAKARLSLPLQPGSELDQWRIIVRRYMRSAKLEMEAHREFRDLAAVQDMSGLLLRLIKSSPSVSRDALS